MSDANNSTEQQPSGPPPKTVDVELVVPITIGNTERKKLTCRRLRTADRIAVDEMGIESDIKREIALFALMTGLAPDELNQLDLADYAQLQKQYLDFTQARPSKK